MKQRAETTVLIVDDEYLIRESLGGFLEDSGLTVFLAASAENALEILKAEDIDCAIVDLRLPGIDGNSLILSAHELYPSLHVLIFTGSSNYEIPPRLKKIGMTNHDVYFKPLTDLSILVEAIDRKVFKG